MLSFDLWMQKVDTTIAKKCGGLASRDLPDCCYADWHEDGKTPAGAASAAIRYAKGEGELY